MMLKCVFKVWASQILKAPEPEKQLWINDELMKWLQFTIPDPQDISIQVIRYFKNEI